MPIIIFRANEDVLPVSVTKKDSSSNNLFPLIIHVNPNTQLK